MKKISLLLLLIVLTLSMVSCKKDYFRQAENPSFATLNNYLGRTDLDAVKEELKAKGFNITCDESYLIQADKAESKYSESYYFDIKKGAITRAEYGYDDDAAVSSGTAKSPIKEHVKDKLAEEKEFIDQSLMTKYVGTLEIASEDEDEESEPTTYTSKDEFITAVTDLDFKYLSDGLSTSTYQNIKTEISFDFDALWVSVKAK